MTSFSFRNLAIRTPTVYSKGLGRFTKPVDKKVN